MARLQWLDRDGKMIALEALPILVGKDAACLIRPTWRVCAPRHARFYCVEGAYFVEAVSPEHAVLVNGTAVSTHALVHRDTIRCGGLEITYWQD